MTISIAVICEARADFETGTGLTDRILCQAADWIADNSIDDFRCYRGEVASEAFLLWREVNDRFADHGRPLVHGRFGGRSRRMDWQVALQGIRLITGSLDEPDAIILLRDEDRAEGRKESLESARSEEEERGVTIPIIIGLATTKRECWVLAGFVPATDEERNRLEKLRQELSFDPCRESVRLNDKNDGELRSAKRVLRELVQDRQREVACWQETPLQVLCEQGSDTGIVEFFDELRTRLVPLFV